MAQGRGELDRRDWRVAGALIEGPGGLLLVANQRRDASIDWTPPGGVIDRGESVLDALGREVAEETGLTVETWSAAVYEVTVDFGSRGMTLHVSAHVATSWSGSLVVDDPDEIVVDAGFYSGAAARDRLGSSPRWVRDPVGEWLDGPWVDPRYFGFRVDPEASGPSTVVRVQ